MNKFIFNEKILNDVFQNTKIKKNEEKDFIFWAKNIVRSLSNNKIDTVNFNSGKISKFEGIAIEKAENLIPIFYLSNSKFLDALIVILDKFGFNYWEEKLSFLINKKDLEKLGYSNVLIYAYNNIFFIEKQNQNIKKLLEQLVQKIEEDKINYYSEVLQILLLLSNKKDLFGNEWLIKSIDKLIIKSQKNMSKQFSFVLEKMSYMLKELDFTNIKISKDLKKILRGDMVIIKNTDLFPFYCEVDVHKYWQEEKLVEQIVINNITIGFNLIVENFQRDVEVLDIYIKKPNKTSLAIVLMSDNQKTVEKIDGLVTDIFKMCKESEVLVREKFEKNILFLMLNDDLKTNTGSSSGRRTKI